ncbi:MAG: tripartite tricarboxylate transporter substrate binding protein [Hyphomicrobiales bacterium]|nr:tripartite tricarboxylate transporter substrate binding protein [Hyphomicrobiales bacterium]
MLTKRALVTGMMAAGFGLSTARSASAQSYPARPVKMIVPLPAGSAPDIRHRMIAQSLSQMWGQQVVVENRPGGGGLIGTRGALGEAPDGYTLLVALASVYTILPAQNEKLPFDVNTDIVPLGLTASEGLVFACSSKLGVTNLAELIALANKNPDRYVIGTNPAGSLPHLAAKLFVEMTKTAIGVVPYSTGGTNEAIRDIMGGRVHAVIDGWAALRGALDSGDLKALAILSPEPTQLLPSLPTALGTVPGYTAIGWQALAVRNGTPEPIVRKLTEDLDKILKDPQLQKKLQETGPEFTPMNGANLRRFIESEQKLWGPLAKKYAT